MKKSYAIPAIIAFTSFSTAILAQPEGPSDPAPVAPAAAPAPAPAEANPPTAQTPAAAAQLVEREFATYDLDKSGQLDATEFAAWIAKLRTPATDGAPPTDAQQFAATLFARADVDHDQKVSRTEMTTLLNGAQG